MSVYAQLLTCIDTKSISVLHYVQLAMEIKRVGIRQANGTVCTTFRQLQRGAEGVIPDFIGTLMLARKYQVYYYGMYSHIYVYPTVGYYLC